jgi:hypothetical protein
MVAVSSPAAAELTAIYQDQGYVRSDAEKLTAFTVLDIRRKRSGRVLGQSRQAIAEAFRVGVIGWEEAAVRLYRVRFETPEQRLAFDRLARVDQLEAARSDPEVLQALAQLDFEADVRIAKQHIASIRSGYVTGRSTRDQAEVSLRRLGVAIDRIERYLTLWDSQKSGSRKLITVAKLTRYARDGILNEPDFRGRLGNLGYQPDDVNAIVAGVRRDIVLDAARLAEKQARTEAGRQAAIARQIRQQQQEQQRARQRLLKLSTAAQLAVWVERGILSPAQMLSRLLEMGVASADAEAKVVEAEQRYLEREERRARQRQRQ